MSESTTVYGDMDDRHDRFTALLLPAQQRIFCYILTLLPDRTAAEDVLQEVATVMWRKFDEFEPGTDFSAWATSIARLRVLEHYRQKKRQPLQFTDQTLAMLCDRAEAAAARSDELRASLRVCMSRLTSRQRSLLAKRYDDGLKPVEIARQTDRAHQTVYRSLGSIHRRLFECIRSVMSGDTA